MKNLLSALVVLLLITTACRKDETRNQSHVATTGNDILADLVVADTIIYEVIIRNPNPDDAWAAKCLEGLNHRMLVDRVFEMIYSGKTMAYNHETNEKLTPKQLEDIEAGDGFSRDNIGMIQFTEVWHLNPGEATMTKSVLSLVLGYNYYTSEGDLIGHKALFRMEL